MLEGALERLVGLHQAVISIPPPSRYSSAKGLGVQVRLESLRATNIRWNVCIFSVAECHVSEFLSRSRVRWSAIPPNRTMTFALYAIKIRGEKEDLFETKE